MSKRPRFVPKGAVFNLAQFALLAVLASTTAGLCQDDGARAEAEGQASAPRHHNATSGLRPVSIEQLKASLDDNDQLAVLESLHIGLSELGDGAAYVWHRRQGLIGGTVSPTASFIQSDGTVCRHVALELVLGDYTSKTETIACRQADKRWTLNG